MRAIDAMFGTLAALNVHIWRQPLPGMMINTCREPSKVAVSTVKQFYTGLLTGSMSKKGA